MGPGKVKGLEKVMVVDEKDLVAYSFRGTLRVRVREKRDRESALHGVRARRGYKAVACKAGRMD